MKKIIFVLMFLMVTMVSVDAHRYRHNPATISVQTFYDELAPYGDWLYTPEYGYVWRPYFDQPEYFRPYSSNGNWVFTDYGWTWVSDYRWGWAPFHYGRWYMDDYLGWMWIPGLEWAPAWVTWGSYNDYWGWAPLGPEIYVNVNFNWMAPDFWWTFVPCRHFYSHNWRNYVYDRPVHVTNIVNITNIYVDNNDRRSNNWFRGPAVNEVERYGRTRVRRMDVVQTDRSDNFRVDNGRLNVYRPQVDERRDNYRPGESRNIENARNGRRIEQKNPRFNDPGMNRSRESRGEIRQDRQVPDQRNRNEQGAQPKRDNGENQRSIENRNNRSSGTQGERKNEGVNARENSNSNPDLRKKVEPSTGNPRKSESNVGRNDQSNSRNQDARQNVNNERKNNSTPKITTPASQKNNSDNRGRSSENRSRKSREARDNDHGQANPNQRRK